jgi:hypothetical protein
MGRQHGVEKEGHIPRALPDSGTAEKRFPSRTRRAIGVAMLREALFNTLSDDEASGAECKTWILNPES